MRILLLGGNGFIGSHVVDALLASGHQVRVFDRGPELFREPVLGVEYQIGSFSDLPMLAEALEGVDVVYHLISTTVPSTSNLDPLGDIEGNLICTVSLLQLMVQMNIRRIIYLSSGGTVYGIPQTVPIPESHTLNPICSYGVVKVAIENYLHMFRSLHGLKPLILRVSNPYGERQGHQGIQGVISTFLYRAIRREPVVVWGDGSVIRDFIYVGDLASFLADALLNSVCGVFNVGSGIGNSITEIVECVEGASGLFLQIEYRNQRDFDISRIVLDISRTRREFGWTPQVGLLEGVQHTWTWMSSAQVS